MSRLGSRVTTLQRALGSQDTIRRVSVFSNWASLVFTGAAVVIAALAYESARYESLRNAVLDTASETRGYFVDHIAGHEMDAPRASPDAPRTSAAQSEAGVSVDREARTILDHVAVVWRLPDGTELVVDSWRLPDGRAIGADQVFPVRGWEWISPVFPEGDREGESAACALQAGGELTVLGFSQTLGAVLVEYSIRAAAGGAFCESGTLLFYSPATLLDRAGG